MYKAVIDRWARVVYILEQGYRSFSEINSACLSGTSHACDGGEERDAHVSGSGQASQGAAATRKACIVDLADVTSLGSSQNEKNTLRRSHADLCLVPCPYLPRVERKRRWGNEWFGRCRRHYTRARGRLSMKALLASAYVVMQMASPCQH